MTACVVTSRHVSSVNLAFSIPHTLSCNCLDRDCVADCGVNGSDVFICLEFGVSAGQCARVEGCLCFN